MFVHSRSTSVPDHRIDLPPAPGTGRSPPKSSTAKAAAWFFPSAKPFLERSGGSINVFGGVFVQVTSG